MVGSASGRHIPHDAIGTLTQLFSDGVSLVNDKVLIEDLEDLAPRHVRHREVAGICGFARLRRLRGRRFVEVRLRVGLFQYRTLCAEEKEQTVDCVP